MEKLAFSINGTPINGAGNAPTGGLFSTTGSQVIPLFVTYFYIAAVILALFFIVWGGIGWIISGGDKQKLAQARQRIVFAIVGLIIAFLAYLIISVIGNFLGIDLLQTGGGSGGKKKAYLENNKVFQQKIASNWVLTK
jgi:hypothetical protein